MKHYKVYEIINTMGSIEWVGETSRSLEARMYEHKKKPQTNNTCGRFYGRSDVSIHLIAEFNNRTEALALEKQLKLEYGIEYTDFIGGKKCVESGHLASIASSGGKVSQLIERQCPYCNVIMKGSVYFRFHGNKCKLNNK